MSAPRLEDPNLIPVADLRIARVQESSSRLMLPALLDQCRLADSVAAAATTDLCDATVCRCLWRCVDHRAATMAFHIVLDQLFPCSPKRELSRAQQGSRRSRIHGCGGACLRRLVISLASEWLRGECWLLQVCQCAWICMRAPTGRGQGVWGGAFVYACMCCAMLCGLGSIFERVIISRPVVVVIARSLR
jgi:hypothetical protein